MDPNMPFGFPIPAHGPPMAPNQSLIATAGHPGPTPSPPQSVPGRRTPLGAVGLGGFYAQSGLSTAGLTHQQPPTDENKPGGSHERSQASSSSATLSKQKNRQGKTVRLNINAR